MNRTTSKLSLQEFLALPASNDRYELVEGRLQPKIFAKYKHASLQGRLYRLIDDWCEQYQYGRVCDTVKPYNEDNSTFFGHSEGNRYR